MKHHFQKHYFERNLPHLQPTGGQFFITFRLQGSIPVAVIQSLEQEYQNSIKKILIEKPNDWQAFIYNEQKKYFAKFDHYLDGVKTGNLYLQQAEVAQIVINKIHEYDSQFYDLMAYCIMPNHVHLVIDTALQLSSWEEMTEEKELASISRIMKFIKGGSAHQANSLLNRTGAFWQGESYDHWIRDYKECKNIIRYTLQNPVKAGLTANWQDWPYSYVNENYL